MLVFKVSSFLFQVLSSKTRTSLTRTSVCLFPQDSAFTVKSQSKILAVLCPKPRCIDTVPLEITVVCLLSVQWEDTTAEILPCSLLSLLQIHFQIINQKNPNCHDLCIFHPFSHKAIYNIIQYFRKTRHFKVYENILLHQIYSGKLSSSATAT